MLSPSTLIEIPNEILGPNQILARLKTWDDRLTPNQGLRRWNPDDGTLNPIASVPAIEHPEEKPAGILLVIHGTFSTGDAIFEQLASIEHSSAFLNWASSRYEHILAFDHPTLSVSPILNGLDLARLFADVNSPVDVICHSRGGLVTRWWLEAFGGAKIGPRRVVFVSSPLGGTSLASPSKIREAFDLSGLSGNFIASRSSCGTAGSTTGAASAGSVTGSAGFSGAFSAIAASRTRSRSARCTSIACSSRSVGTRHHIGPFQRRTKP